MPQINIQGTIIDFPDSAQSPNWAAPVIQFALAVEAALATVVGPFDIAPQVYTMTSNVNTNVSLPGLAFPTSDVRGATIDYTVFRTTNTNVAYEKGTLEIVYNPQGPVNNKWEISREFTGDGLITFSILDTGQVQFTSASLAGTNHQGVISYLAKAILQD